MALLTEAASRELIIPVPPAVIHRTIECRGEGRWAVGSWDHEFGSAFEAMLAVRAEAARRARHPIAVEIRWLGVPAGFLPPTTGTALAP